MRVHGFWATWKPFPLWAMNKGVYRGWRVVPKDISPFMHFTMCNTGMVDCPERKEQVHLIECFKCERFQVWHAKDGDFRRCYHEFRDLSSRGFYDGTWDDHPENFDPEAFERIQEQKRRNEEINREMELERVEFAKNAEELETERSLKSCYDYHYYESDEDEEAEEETNDSDEEEW